VTRKVEIERDGQLFEIEEAQPGVLVVLVNGKPANGALSLPPVMALAFVALFEEVLALGADLDEHALALKRESSRAENMLRNWTEECGMLKEENATMQRKMLHAEARATALHEQLARVQAQRGPNSEPEATA